MLRTLAEKGSLLRYCLVICCTKMPHAAAKMTHLIYTHSDSNEARDTATLQLLVAMACLLLTLLGCCSPSFCPMSAV